ncbi:hypothetical protein COT49_00165 [candidate division WWE3 bacterium CG08_land_8_20_14_0_20_40_13]|uniref:NYN domain-containing protein n=1 Tax=candidate division WWE3 bacterium CG08_land_8_20_14_0_20_40_13 TaxID=1975084 RepID=A0A2H0XEV8_UNCKA|nr:MAG: hypothetical protein COT49_00165 [candidate division WWE3 bacterium CG08_land_8_20_14_0_20_40_13]
MLRSSVNIFGTSIRVSKAFLFIGYIAQNEDLYDFLRSFGYILVFKPTIKDSIGKPKGNVDAELVLHSAAIEFSNYNKAIVVSGDGDFCCLYDFLIKRRKLLNIVVPNSKSESTLLTPFKDHKTYLIFEKKKLEWK